MEITKYGKPPSERIWYGKCSNCGTEAIAKEKELNNIVRETWKCEAFSWEYCPVCKKGKNHLPNKFPYHGMSGYGGLLFKRKDK